MKTTSLSFLAVAAAFALQACAAPTVGSTDAPSIDDANPASAANEETASPAAKLAGAFGAPAEATMQAGSNAVLGGEAKAGTPAKTQLFFESTGATYDIFSYDFGIAAGPMMLAGGMRDAAKPTLMPLSVSMKASPLAKEAFGGKPLGNVVLKRIDSMGKPVDVAVFGNASILSVQSSAAGADGVIESYAIAMQWMQVNANGGSAWVKYDAMTNETKTSNVVCSGELPGFVQSTQSMDVIAKGSVRVDTVSVGVSGAPASLDGIAVSGSLANMGVCAVYDAATGKGPKAAHVAVAAPSQSTWKPLPREATTWDACAAMVSVVSFSGSYDGAPNEAVTLDAAGLVRTDRTFDSYGAEKSTSTFGWSFAGNVEIESCSELTF